MNLRPESVNKKNQKQGGSKSSFSILTLLFNRTRAETALRKHIGSINKYVLFFIGLRESLK